MNRAWWNVTPYDYPNHFMTLYLIFRPCSCLSYLCPFKQEILLWLLNIYDCVYLVTHLMYFVWKDSNNFNKIWWLLRSIEVLSAQPVALPEKGWSIWKADRHRKKMAELVWNPDSSAVQWVSGQTIQAKSRRKFDLVIILFSWFTETGSIKPPQNRPARQRSDLNKNLFSWLMATSYLLVSVFSWDQWEWSSTCWNARCVKNMALLYTS